MTIDELKILLDINDSICVLKTNAKKCGFEWLFVDSNDGHCYLFDKNGKEKDIHSLIKIFDQLMYYDQVFYEDCTLTKIVVPSSVMNIRNGAFYGCINLTSVAIPDTVTNIEYKAFFGCSGLTCVTIPNSMKCIGSSAFEGCSRLTSMTIPDSVTRIREFAFSNCSGLTNMTIGNNVNIIGWQAFIGCNNLKSLIFKGKTFEEVKAMENYPFGIKNKLIIKCEA